MPGTVRSYVCALASAGVLVSALLTTALPASAAVGQLESWGSFGTGNGQFSAPGMLGVDTSDGSVFVGDLTKENPKDREFFRIQKLSSTGAFQASVEIPRYQNIPTNTKPAYLWGIAVDPALHRFYLLEGQAEKETFGEPVAKRILVFSTVPKEGKLVPPEGGPSTLPVPTGENFVEGLFRPRAIQVDPSNHDLVIMAENKSSPKHTVFQRVSSAGVIGAKFSDSGNALRPSNESAVSFTIGPDGTIYAVTGRHDMVAKGHTRAWEIPPAFTSIAQVPGFAEAVDSEESPFGALTMLAVPASKFFGGPEIAISPDGGTLYWQDSVEESVKPTTAGDTIVHGFSLSGKATAVTYGDGEKGKCRIETSGSGLATIGEKVIVFDYGPLNEEKSESPAYGDRLYVFGPGGSGCNPPTARFKANGTEGDVKVKKGETVAFDASGSELASGPSKTAGFRRELIWKFGDGTEKVVTGTGGGEAPATVSHQYASSGDFKVALQIHLKNPTWGNPVAVEHGVEVEGGGGPQKFKLSLTVGGTGTGTVTSTPAGLTCTTATSPCSTEFTEGTLVKLAGTPGAGSKPVSFTGCDTVNGANECEVTMGAAKNVTATFQPIPKFLLKVTDGGTGTGTVTSSPSGINCGSTCEASFVEGTLVKLTGSPNPGSKPVAWSGCDKVNGANECEVTMSAAASVTATFDRELHTLKITRTGTGTVTSSPSGINCGSTCEASFMHGELVKLGASPAAGFEPASWTGCDAVNASDECEVTMGAAKNVTATFLAMTPKLTVSLAGSGTGSVASAPAGIACGTECEEEFAYGTLVKLTGTKGAGSKDVVWSGCDKVNGSGQCEVTMTAAKNVTAAFSPVDLNALIVTPAGTGSGTVTSAPAGIDCGTQCTHDFSESALVKLTGTPDPGSKAVAWSGCDTVTFANECEVAMSAAKAVTATFDAVAHHQLDVVTEGTGSGTVTSSPAGIECGSVCQADFAEGTLVTLTGDPDPGSAQVVWTQCPGTVNGSGQCEVTMDAAKEAKASFTREERALTVVPAGTGSGAVSSLPAGVECGSTCQASFAKGALVKLTGTPDAGSKAVAWSGCDKVNGANECEVTMSAAASVTATFDLAPPVERSLNVSVNGTGTGTVASTPAGLTCTTATSPCSAEFTDGALVKLTGTPDPGSKAVAWSGCDTVTFANECEVAMSAAKAVTATFDAVPSTEQLLKVSVNGTGSGAVTSAPAGIECGSKCEAEFGELTLVRLTGTPATGSGAVLWSGCDLVNASNECEVAMSAEREVTATFTAITPLLTVTNLGTASGEVTSSPAGIECGSDCTEPYAFGATVTLTAVPDDPTDTVEWVGCGTQPSATECVVTMTAARFVTATFSPPQAQLAVVKTGGAAGWVGSAPASIACGETCEASFDLGTVVTLTGLSGLGAREVAWTGCDQIASGNRCEVTVSAAKNVTATFAPLAGPPEEEPAPEPEEEAPAPKKHGSPKAKKAAARQRAVARCRRKFKPGKARTKCVRKASGRAATRVGRPNHGGRR